MAWMKIDQNLPAHPKTIGLRTLRRHKNTDETSGFLVRLWGWALDVKPDGMIAEIPGPTLAEALKVRSGEELLAHLQEAGFVCTERCAERGLDPVAHRPGRIHDWDETGGELARQRALDAERKRLVRAHERGHHAEKSSDGCPKCVKTQSASSGQGRRSPSVSSGQAPDARADTRVDRDDPPGVPRWGQDVSSGQNRTGQERPADVSRARAREVDKTRGRVDKTPPTPALSRGPDGSRRTPPPVAEDPVAEDPVAEQAKVRVALMLEGAAGRWRAVLEQLLAEGMSRANLITWFEGARLEGEGVVVCPNVFTRDWLADARKGYGATLRRVLQRDDLRFVTADELVEDEPEIPDA